MNREKLMATKNEEIVDQWNKSARGLCEINDGADVFCQNPHTRVWDRSGRVIECLPYRQFRIRLDGTGRITLRNRRHLRQRYSGTLVTPNVTYTAPSSSAPGTTISISSEQQSYTSSRDSVKN